MNMDTVRVTLNNWRNYVQQELRKLMFKEVWVPQSPIYPDLAPYKAEILKLALRNGVGKESGLEPKSRFLVGLHDVQGGEQCEVGTNQASQATHVHRFATTS